MPEVSCPEAKISYCLFWSLRKKDCAFVICYCWPSRYRSFVYSFQCVNNSFKWWIFIHLWNSLLFQCSSDYYARIVTSLAPFIYSISWFALEMSVLCHTYSLFYVVFQWWVTGWSLYEFDTKFNAYWSQRCIFCRLAHPVWSVYVNSNRNNNNGEY